MKSRSLPIKLSTQETKIKDQDELEDWLNAMAKVDPDSDINPPMMAFPTDEMLKNYVSSIDQRELNQVKHLLRCFLFEYVNFGTDVFNFRILQMKDAGEIQERLASREYGKRLVNPRTPAHPGVRWIIDLLPHWPNKAMEVIDAYIMAHGQSLPDRRLEGLWDATALISAKYLSRKSSNAAEALAKINPRELEHLTANLYSKMGFSCTLTAPTNDGGRDVIAKREQPGRREHRVIDCAHYGGSVPITKARAILGTADNDHATSAVLLTTGRISKNTYQMASKNSKLDLVDGTKLVELLDRHLGHAWPREIDYWIQWPPRR
ncbi:restriction endonuclease [Arthrobacter sp. JUb115]|uniref:restriction endonuclease n=1 Tax=Arthrobacter sp. JUb115 TaxID=2485108 RepID=UPI001414F545|nr:restriction endonuclease [Arthrobacter sp. JUb115]